MPSSHVIHAAEKHLQRILSNLIVNAINASNAGRVLLGVKAVGNDINIVVADNGHGIAPDDQTRIFEKFVQVNQLAKGGPSGLGLGLSRVTELCALMNMPLSLFSELDRGTVFTASAPTVAAPLISGQEADANSSLSPMRPWSFL